jgi:hypothetical protein
MNGRQAYTQVGGRCYERSEVAENQELEKSIQNREEWRRIVEMVKTLKE